MKIAGVLVLENGLEVAFTLFDVANSDNVMFTGSWLLMFSP